MSLGVHRAEDARLEVHGLGEGRVELGRAGGDAIAKRRHAIGRRLYRRDTERPYLPWHGAHRFAFARSR
jgi:hypothetical protein